MRSNVISFVVSGLERKGRESRGERTALGRKRRDKKITTLKRRAVKGRGERVLKEREERGS